MAPWTYRQVLAGVERLAQEHRVHLAYVDPRNTSRTCPQCGTAAKENRAGEAFRCAGCNYTADADYVGALNILSKTAGHYRELMGPAS